MLEYDSCTLGLCVIVVGALDKATEGQPIVHAFNLRPDSGRLHCQIVESHHRWITLLRYLGFLYMNLLIEDVSEYVGH